MNYLSFDEFCGAAKAAPLQTVKPDGLHIDGVRYNCRKLRAHIGAQVRVQIEEDIISRHAICFTPDGVFICTAREKFRPYNNCFAWFLRALELEPKAIRMLHHFKPWHGEPWWKHLADVYWNVFTERPMLALPAPRLEAQR